MRTILAACLATCLTPAALAQPQSISPTVTVGPWTIATSYKADKLENCSMSRSAGGLGISFALMQDGLSLLLDSPKWKLERGKTYPVKLAAGGQILDAKALAETKAVAIALIDGPFNLKLRSSNLLEVRGEGATLQVPLDGSAAALDRLESCYEKNSRSSAETNPFVAPSRRP